MPDGRCHSWRPGPKAHEPLHEPGRCHRCWRPCWSRVAADGLTVRCDDCVDAILRLNVPRLSRQMLSEPYVPDRLSERLVSDFDAGVAMAASDRLDQSARERNEALVLTVELPPVQAPLDDSPARPEPGERTVAVVDATELAGFAATSGTAPSELSGTAPSADRDDDWGDKW